MRHALHLASGLALGLAACGGEGPAAPDPAAPAAALTEREQTVGYQEAGSFVQHLLESQGEAPMRDFFARGRREADLEEVRASFLASFGFTLLEAEARWRGFLSGEG